MRRLPFRLLSLIATVALGAGLYWLIQKPDAPSPSPEITGMEPSSAATAPTPATAGSPHNQPGTSPAENTAPPTASPNVLWLPGAPTSLPSQATSRIPGLATASPAVALDIRNAIDTLPSLAVGDRLTLPLLHGELANAVVTFAQRDSHGTLRLAASVENHPGASISLSLAGTTLAGRVLLPDSRLAYSVTTLPSGQAFLKEDALSSILCDPLPRAPVGDTDASLANAPSSPTASSGGPQAIPPIHSSRPSATAVLYLDFDGETVTDPDWNNGLTIVAAASYLAEYEITEVWKRVSEDFAPFNIDITTSLARYEAAPVGRRMRCIITPTDTWYPRNVGGVAYLNSFARAGTGFSTTVPCWVFN